MSDGAIKRYAYIDALRGYAILGVIAVHSTFHFDEYEYLFERVFVGGQYGVHLFFVASALTLFLSLSKRSEDEKSPYRNFFIRRFFRIAPLFWFGILVYYLLGLVPWDEEMGSLRPELEPWNYWLTFAFLHGWHPATINKVVPGDWSIAVEVTFYLLVPWLFLWIKNLRMALWVLIAVVILALIFDRLIASYAYLVFPDHSPRSFREFNFVRQLPVFLIGVSLYFLLAKHNLEKWLADNNYTYMMLVALLLAFVFCRIRIMFISLQAGFIA